MFTSMNSSKRKRVVLAIKDKVAVLKMLGDGYSTLIIAKNFGIGRRTVSNIKKNLEKILAFERELEERGTSKEKKTMGEGDDKELDEAVYVWFR